MPPHPSLLADPQMRAVLATGLNSPVSPRAAQLSTFVATAFGPTTVALLHYGSQAHSSDARPESAHDFVVIVDDYLIGYRSLAARVGTSYRPRTAAWLNRVLPPNVISVTDRSAATPLQAKCAVFSLRDFQRACSARAQDHFLRGRLFQPAQLLWTRDEAARRAVTAAVLEVRAGAFERRRASLPPYFDVETYCRAMIATSFAAEIRPERPERVEAILAAQRTEIVPMYAALLRWLGRAGVLEPEGETYRDPRPRGRWERIRLAQYYRRSKLRATLRWVKYIALYDNWLDYVSQKVARRSGVMIELTERERRWPLIFLWPKAIRYLRQRPQRRTEP
jgi:hypothetical protein